MDRRVILADVLDENIYTCNISHHAPKLAQAIKSLDD